MRGSKSDNLYAGIGSEISLLTDLSVGWSVCYKRGGKFPCFYHGIFVTLAKKAKEVCEYKASKNLCSFSFQSFILFIFFIFFYDKKVFKGHVNFTKLIISLRTFGSGV